MARVDKRASIKEAINKAYNDNNSLARAKGNIDTTSLAYKTTLSQFEQAVARQHLAKPFENSAFAYYKQLLRSAPDHYLDVQRNQLLNAIQSHFQQYSERFYDELGYSEEELEQIKIELEAGMQLTAKKVLVRNSFYSKKLFIDACLITYKGQHGYSTKLLRSQLQSAADSLEKAVKLTPHDPKLYRKLSDCYLDMNPQKAIEFLKVYTGLLPKDGSAYNALGIGYYSTNEFNSAVIAFEKAINLAPEIGKYYYNLGMCYQKMGRQGDADMYFKKSKNIKQSIANDDYQ
ncbi:MAG: hypothetical protein JWP69_2242 [Flaviaesturariibacter sp.]|nr:hypothetical protein [Flaviaesturariibacter sp.]